MNIVCLDMEGVLVPEIWIAFAEESGIPELRRTTRDEPDYDKLMRWRIDLLRQRGLKLSAIQETISRIDPLPGAREFLDELRRDTQVVILSDTFDQFAMPLMAKLGYPTLLCNTLAVDEEGYITRHGAARTACRWADIQIPYPSQTKKNRRRRFFFVIGALFKGRF